MKNFKTIKILLVLLGVCILFGCGRTVVETKAVASNNQKTSISSQQVEKYDFNLFILRFSNIIYEYQGKKFKFPIFQGTSGDVLYNDYLDYCWNHGLMSSDDIETGFVIKCKKGEIRKTLLEFVAFYKSNILKDAENPEIIYFHGKHNILYHMKINGVTWILSIRLILIDDDYTSVYDLKPDENIKEPNFIYNFDISKD